ncbi:MAG: adenosylcobalamin-dependent ribonucleoside-diphosphate reductase [Candidatus Curtissbacteria bacterium]|nr:adenosylcobalamin-dependent ribonucleoside-diphosphate reductase [Candidatus Curtissbacteria bacterium]
MKQRKFDIDKVDTRSAVRAKVRKIGRQIPKAPKDLSEPALSENAAYIAKTRYAFRNEKGEPIESPKDMFWRIAYYIGAADEIYLPRGKAGHGKKTHEKSSREFYEIMATQKFIPNTPTLVNSGKTGQSLSACFVLPVEDNLESILKTMHDMAMIHKMGGGTGFSFSHLRPKDDVIGTSKGKTTGPVAFLQAYNDVTSQIRQGGVRRGANMGILHYTHPDILRFAVHKVDEFSLTNFNISVTVTENFMKKVKEDEKYVTQEADFDPVIEEIKEAYTIRDLDLKTVRIEEGVIKLYDICRSKTQGEGYDLINPKTGKVTDRLNAKKFFDLITKLAWQYGDPGMILIDRINSSRANPVPNIGPIEATNPCAEQPLHAYDACTLGSINLAKFVVDADEGSIADPERSRRVVDDKSIDWQEMGNVIATAVHFLDNVLDMNEYPVPEIDKMTSAIRRIGLGVMGWADMLVKLGIGYDTREAFDLAEKVMKFVQREADSASVDLAKTRGVFPAFKGSIYDKPATGPERSRRGQIRPRNGARTTIAPTGTISLLADCSSGIEPHFALTYAKNTIEGKRLFNTNSYFKEALDARGLDSEDLLAKISENKGSIQNMDEIPEGLKKTFVVAGDIAPKDHVQVAAAFQKFTDNGISKTINFSNEATVEDVREAYWLSYELGCNMITIYRDGSRVKQVLEVKKGKSYYDQLTGKRTEAEASQEPALPIKRRTPQEAWGMRVRKKADVGQVYTSVFRDVDGAPIEVFVTIGKTGGYVAGAAEVTGRLASRALKYGATLEEVASDLIGIACGTPYGFGTESVLSAFDAIGKSLIEISKAKQLQLPMDSQAQAQNSEVTTLSISNPTNGNGPLRPLSEASHTNANGNSNGHTRPTTPSTLVDGGRANGNGHTNGPLRPLSEASHTNGSNGVQTTLSSLVGTPVPQVEIKQGNNGLVIAALHDEEKALETKFTSCPDCGSPLVYAEGCRKCVNVTCGWSKCS